MSSNYGVEMLYICPFIRLSGLNIVPNLEYPERLCAIDKQKGFAIDVKTNLKYDYLETLSRLYVGSIIEKTKDGRRVAIPARFCDVKSDKDYKIALKVINQLESGKDFPNGNDVLNNEEYLFLVQNENIEQKNDCVKSKKRVKRKK